MPPPIPLRMQANWFVTLRKVLTSVTALIVFLHSQVFAYTASKQQTARNRRLEDENNDIDSHGSDQEHSQVGDETTPLDMVRYAMLQLETLSKNEILDDQHTIPNVTSMLQVLSPCQISCSCLSTLQMILGYRRVFGECCCHGKSREIELFTSERIWTASFATTN